MTRKHFELIAWCIKAQKDSCKMLVNPIMELATLKSLAYMFCGVLKNENSRFDSTRFLIASGFCPRCDGTGWINPAENKKCDCNKK